MQYLFLLKRVFMDQRGATGATGATDSGEDRPSWCSDICDICDILVYGAAYLWINWNTLFFEDLGSSHDYPRILGSVPT